MVSAGAGMWVTGWAISVGIIGGPVTLGAFVIGTATGVTVAIVWEYGVKPVVSWTAIAWGFRDPYQEYHNLRPLRGGQQ